MLSRVRAGSKHLVIYIQKIYLQVRPIRTTRTYVLTLCLPPSKVDTKSADTALPSFKDRTNYHLTPTFIHPHTQPNLEATTINNSMQKDIN